MHLPEPVAGGVTANSRTRAIVQSPGRAGALAFSSLTELVSCKEIVRPCQDTRKVGRGARGR